MTGSTRRDFSLATLALAAASLLPSAARAGQAPSPAGWSRAPDLPIRVQEIYPAVMGGRIYVTGGLSPDMAPEQLNISDRVFSWAPGEASWREEPRLPLPIHHPYGLEREGKLFAIGGFTAREGGRWSMSEVVHLLDPQTGGWRFGPQMPQPLAETVAINHEGTIHLVTGRRPSGFQNTEWPHHSDINAHLALSPGSDAWVTLPPAPTARNSAAGAAVDGRWHVIGGRTVSGGNTPVHEVYDFAANRWETLAPCPHRKRDRAGRAGSPPRRSAARCTSLAENGSTPRAAGSIPRSGPMTGPRTAGAKPPACPPRATASAPSRSAMRSTPSAARRRPAAARRPRRWRCSGRRADRRARRRV
nr:hypothetical protein [Marinicauda algicola]